MKKLLFLFILMLSPMLASAQTVSDVQNSGCLNETRGEDSQGEPTIVLTKEGSVLSVQLLNYESNCGTTDFSVTPEISTNEGETCFLTVNVNPVIPGEMDCICPFNVSFTVRDLEPNSFYLDCWWYKGQVKLREGESLVLEYNNPDTPKYFPEGTKWTEIRLDTLKYDSWYSKVGDEWVPNFETIEYYVQGEYVKKEWDDQNIFKKVYTNGPEWTDSLTLLLQEADNRVMVSVFKIDHEQGSYVLWPGEAYQFDWSIGKGLYYEDITMSNTTSMWQPRIYYGIIDEIKEGYFGGVRPLKYVDLDGKAPEDETGLNRNISTNGGRIIQGIGITEWKDGECLFGPPNPYYASTWEHDKRHYRSMLVHFERNGEVLYNVWPDASPQDEYIPFVKAGKKWNVIRSDFDGDYHHINYRLTNEKVEKAGKTYMKMYRREGYSAVADDERLLREENRKVYIFDPDLQKEFLLFDYSLKAGDTYETYSYDEQKMVSYKVVSVRNFTEGPESIRYDYDEERDSMITQRRYLRKWTVCRTDDNSIQKTWIESVGSLEGPLANLYARPISFKDDLAYVEDNYYYYLPFSFHNEFSHVHGCNLPTGAEDYKEDDERHKLTYELEGNRLHVYGKAFTQCGPNNYAYFYEKKTDDPLVNKIQFVIQEAEPMADCMALHATNFYVPGFDPNMNYIVIDNQGEEHPVINKTPQMDYRPFVEEGKVWKVGTIPTALDSPVQVVDYYYFDGDTIIGGKTCKQMMRQRYVSPNYSNEYWTPRPSLTKVGAWYEEDKKVYSFDERQQTMTLKYDFSLEANDTLHFLNVDDYPPFIIGPKQTGGIEGFKGVYRDIMMCRDEGQNIRNTIWLEGVGVRDAPFRNAYDPRADLVPEFLISCTVGDEVIYLNDRYEDGATPESMGARKNRFDFTHTIKTKPKARKRSEEEPLLYGEYNDLKLGINLNPLDDAYQVRITDDSGKVVYEKAVNAGNIVGLNIDISAYAKGRYTVTVENSRESFTGEFNAQETGIYAITNKKVGIRHYIYNLHGQRLSSLQKGLNIVNGQKLFVK